MQSETLKDLLNLKLEKLVSDLHVDYSALAFYEPINLEFRWRLAVGSLNNRYKGIVVSKGKGVCGWVLKTKRELIINHFPEDLLDDYNYLEYPILIIEEIKSAIAVPLLFKEELIGVLLIGNRTHRYFTYSDIQFIKSIAEVIIQVYIKERNSETRTYKEVKVKEKNSISYFLLEKKKEYGDRLLVLLLDQRITLLPSETQEKLNSIFLFLLDKTFLIEDDTHVKIIIERKSEQQFAIQIEIDRLFELSQEKFTYLADQLRALKGSIEIDCRGDRTLLTMNFSLNILADDRLWTE